jgi:hypothetical protein
LNGLFKGERLLDNVIKSGRNDDLSTRDLKVFKLSARKERDESERNVNVYEFLMDIINVLTLNKSLNNIL